MKISTSADVSFGYNQKISWFWFDAVIKHSDPQSFWLLTEPFGRFCGGFVPSTESEEKILRQKVQTLFLMSSFLTRRRRMLRTPPHHRSGSGSFW